MKLCQHVCLKCTKEVTFRKTHRHQAIDVGKMAFTLDTLFWAILYFVFISWMGCVETRSQGQIKRNYKNE